jgi:outer membrane immunogenic protein
LSAKKCRKIANPGNKMAPLPRGDSCEPLRHCREATKLRPRCLIDVTTKVTGNTHEEASTCNRRDDRIGGSGTRGGFARASLHQGSRLYGGHVGGAFSGDNSLQGSGGRFLGGVQGGFDYQFATNWVIGAEAQYSWLANSNNGGVLFPGSGTLVTSNTDQLGSVTGRLGYTWGPALLYAKGGYAWRDNPNVAASIAGTPVAFTTDGSHKDGYTVGAGLEYMFAPQWSAKIEYQYYNFGSTTFTGGPADVVGSRFRDDEHTVKAGINYRFGWGGPVAARY